MNKLSTAVAAFVCVLGLSMPSPGQAMRMGEGGWITTYECHTSSVITIMGIVENKFCYTTYQPTEGGMWEREFDSMYERPMGGGGGSWSRITPIPVAVWNGNGEVFTNSAGTKVSATAFTCNGDNDDTRREPVMAAVAQQQPKLSPYKAGHEVTLLMPGGDTQVFEKANGGASSQYFPQAPCKPGGT